MKKLFIFFLVFSYQSIFAQLEVTLEPFASGFNSPVAIEHAGDFRLFIVERSGTIQIIDESGSHLHTFLDINAKVKNTSGQSEEGLLGLAFHPNYALNGYFYVHYTNNGGNSVIARYGSTSDPDVADANSEVILMTVNQPYPNHNGGEIAFGPDGYLYVGFGDGGSANDPGNRAQNRQTFLGKMLRIDVDNGSPYAIPPDNPFVNDDSTLDEIWSIGLRNAWKFSFDTQTGDLWMGDVGQNKWEEINFQPATSLGGENYGWRCFEGEHDFNTSGCNNMTDYVAPVAEYNHNGFTHCSVTGGHVYRGTKYPEMRGHYIYGDYCSGRLWSTLPDGSGAWVTQQIANYPGYDISTFGEDSNGELYLARLGQGTIYKITSGCQEGFTFEITETNGNLVAPEGYANYQWFLNGNEIEGAIGITYEPTMSGDYFVIVTENNGCTYSSATMMVIVSNTNQPNSVQKILISPNPFYDRIDLQIESIGQAKVELNIVNIKGQEVYRSTLNIHNQATKNIDLNNLKSGIYIMNFKTKQGILTKKIVKQ